MTFGTRSRRAGGGGRGRLEELLTTAHDLLRERLTAHLERLSSTEVDDDDVAALLSFLEGELLPHMEAKARVLYPAVTRLGAAGETTATMHLDHDAVRAHARLLRDAGERLRALRRDRRTEQLAEILELQVRLDAIMRLHLQKEEAVFLPLLVGGLAGEEQARLADALLEVPRSRDEEKGGTGPPSWTSATGHPRAATS